MTAHGSTQSAILVDVRVDSRWQTGALMWRRSVIGLSGAHSSIEELLLIGSVVEAWNLVAIQRCSPVLAHLHISRGPLAGRDKPVVFLFLLLGNLIGLIHSNRVVRVELHGLQLRSRHEGGVALSRDLLLVLDGLLFVDLPLIAVVSGLHLI